MKATLRNALKRIAAGQPHRFSQDTYHALLTNDLARFEDGWHLTDAGRAALKDHGVSPAAKYLVARCCSTPRAASSDAQAARPLDDASSDWLRFSARGELATVS